MPDQPHPIPLLDLTAQYEQIREEIEPLVLRIMREQRFVLGPEVESFESELATYVKARFGVGCASGSDALLLALMALGVKPGDEVVCPTFTFFATAGAISRLGARPVFVDMDPLTFNLDPAHARIVGEQCTRLKAIIPVHLFGQCADMVALETVARDLNVPIIEDAAQAIGSEDALGRRAGSMGDLGCFSFYPTKNLGAFGDAGLCTTHSPEWAEVIKLLRVHGDTGGYHHIELGYNARLDALQAAVLRIKLKHLDTWTAARQKHAKRYDAIFSDAGAASTRARLEEGELPLCYPEPGADRARHVYNQYVIRVPAAKREGLKECLRENGIGSGIYYPRCLHQQPCFSNLGNEEGAWPQAEAAAREVLALPIFPELTEAEVERVAETILKFLK